MKKCLKLQSVLFMFILLGGMLATWAVAGPIPQGDTQVNLMLHEMFRVGIQYRIMYNASNIPHSGMTFVDTGKYDFFRQRMRFNIDVRPLDNIGGFMQLEYRGGWGGSSPENSDPRGAGLTVNAFNRLNARGVRYGYIYYTPKEKTYLAAGIIPISDQLGDTLFSADWDFNVGGITFSSIHRSVDYRLAYVRLIDGVASADRDVVGKNSDMLIGDVNFPIGETAKAGAHIYYVYASEELGTAAGLPGKVSQGWYGLSGSVNVKSADINGFVCINNGDYGPTDNLGWALKGEAGIPLGTPTFKFLAVYSTGDKEGETPDGQFRTVESIFGTQGYWAYTHLFTANGPSDVNDLGVGLANGGRGLTSIQAKVEAPLINRLTGELVVGWFQASKENAAGNKTMGTELAGMSTVEIAKYLKWDIGLAYAFLGDFYKVEDQDPENLFEIFSRFQLQF